jgi:tetratricopeptide (TPR) repeat protein
MYKKYSILLVCALLGLSTLIAYWPVKNHNFTILDDYDHIVNNPTVKNGLTYDGVTCAFTSCAITNGIALWHPLTWLSLMLDYELYGLKPGGYHITNFLFHIANTILLFLILNLMTHALWRSAFVAMLFALHPLHVESVAWVTERKDVLSAFFGILTIGAYVLYSKRPGIARYAVMLFVFAFGLMSKSMLVTWPFVLLLLDYWPLKRFQQGRLPQKSLTAHPNPSPGKPQKKINRNPVTTEGMPVHETAAPYKWPVIRRRIVEKIPLAVLSLLCSIITYDITLKAGALDKATPLIFRIENALVSYTTYIRKMFWPNDLCVIYPYPDALSMWQIVGSVLVIISITGLALRFARRFPYLPVGWFWYIGTLIPVIGLIQAGIQAMADRYTYLPLVGLFIVIAWGITDLTRKWRHQRPFLVISSGVLLLTLLTLTWSQLHLWSDNVLLYEHSLNKTKENTLIHRALGETWYRKGNLDKAILHERQVFQLEPTNADAQYNLGIYLSEQGKITEAIDSFKEALRLKPNRFLAHDHLGKLLVLQGRNEEAMIHFQRAIQVAPKFFDAYIHLGDALASHGKLGEAADIYSRAIAVNPESAYAHYNLGTILASQGKIDEAIIHFREAARISPRYAKAHNNLGSMLLMKGNTEEAIDHFKMAIEIEPGYEMARMNLEDALRILNISGSYSPNPASKK